MKRKKTTKNAELIISDTIGHILHEIVKPINAAQSIAQNIRLVIRDNPNKAEQELRRLDESLNRINSIIAALHELSQSSLHPSDTLTDKKEYCNINTLCEMALIQLMAKNKGLKLNVEYSAKCNLLCNSTEIIQVIINLLKNAIEAQGESEISIWIKTNKTKDNKKVQLKIVNRGSPIPHEFQSKIFEPGFSTKRNHAGLGLSMVKELVEKNDGRIEVCSPYLETNQTMFKIVFLQP